jgi:hypothetical protein
MASNVESGFYWMGFSSGFNGEPWSAVTKRGFQPGTRAFHQFLEGNGDGAKARILARHHEKTSTHHAHGGDYHTH